MARRHRLPPEPLLIRISRPLGLALGLVLAALIFVAVTYRWWRIPGGGIGEDIAVAECRAAYRRSHSMVDSAMIDVQRPIVSRGQATVARTCRELRLAGALGR